MHDRVRQHSIRHGREVARKIWHNTQLAALTKASPEKRLKRPFHDDLQYIHIDCTQEEQSMVEWFDTPVDDKNPWSCVVWSLILISVFFKP